MPSIVIPSRALTSAILVALLALEGGCVYPTTEPTGVELSWRFVEHEAAEGEDDPRTRTCEGAVAEQLAFEISDDDAPRRHGVFRFDCATGYQTAVQVQTSASDAFVPLDPGAYTIAVSVVDDASNAQRSELVMQREVTVEEREVTVELWELARARVPWTLELRGADACERVTLSLFYAAPELSLADHVPDDEDEPPLLYRPDLASDRELAVGGQGTECSATLDGLHRFEGVERGDYVLALDVDGLACEVRVDLQGRDGATSVIDLASLPCGG